uniref:Putative methyltransferase n=1 Tax=viral metagenome TaxID=1070528 RepID=A0A6M3KSX2_9ZZZZ
MLQTVRIIDPNYNLHRRLAFEDDGKAVISLMRERGVDKEVRDQMRVYLATQQNKFKKTALNKEITRHGSPLTIAAFGSETVGIYNPDVIPIDTYLRMKTDPQVAIGLAMIKMPLYSLGWTIECEDLDIRKFVHTAINRVWRKLIVSALTAIDFGFASHELVWEMLDLDISSQNPAGRKKTHFSGKAEVLKKVKAHYPSTIKIRTDSKTDEFIGIVQRTMSGADVSLDAEKCFLFTMGDEFGNFFGMSRMKPAYKSWYWKEVLTQFMLRYFERRGSPATVVQHPIGGGLTLEGDEYDNSDIALRISQNLLENSSVTLPYEADKDGRNQWGISYLTDDRRGEMFVNALNYLGAQILRGLLTPERVMTQDLSTGSFSMASSHAEIFLLSEEGLAKQIEGAINEQIIPSLVQFNFNPKKQVECSLRIEKIQYDRRRILKEIMVEVLRNVNNWVSSGKTPNVMPSIKQMCDVLGIPIIPIDEEYDTIETITDEDSGATGNKGSAKDKGNANNKKEKEVGIGKSEKGKGTIKREPVKKSDSRPWDIRRRVLKFNDITKRGWLAAYKSKDTHWTEDQEHSDLADVLIANEKVNKTKGNILEIGCGNGRDSKFFGESGYKVTSIDISPIAIDLAIKNNSHENVEYLVGDAEKLEFDDGQFDLVYSLSVLHSTNMEKSFAEIKRVLKEGGLVLAYLYEKTDYYNDDNSVRTEINFETESLKKIFDDNGLNIVDSYDTEGDVEETKTGKHKHFIQVYLLKKEVV